MLCTSPEDPSRLSGAVVEALRGNCTFLQKGLLAQEAGARSLLVISATKIVSHQGRRRCVAVGLGGGPRPFVPRWRALTSSQNRERVRIFLKGNFLDGCGRGGEEKDQS